MNTIKSLTKDGITKEYQVILTYYDKEYKKNYIVYTDNKYNENNELQIYIDSYNENNKQIVTKGIEDPYELNKINDIINNLLLTMQEENEKL